MSPHRHPLLTIRNLTPRNTGRMFKHERDYSEENSFPRTAQRSTREKNSDQRRVSRRRITRAFSARTELIRAGL